MASTGCSKGCFWGQRAKQTILSSVLLRSFVNDLVEFVRSLSFMKLCHLVRQRLPLFSRLADILNIKPSEIMAMGDANNDIEMLQFAGLGIAMGNASDYVKSLADDVTASNEEDGVAHAIEKYIL